MSEPTIDERVRALEAAMRLLETSTAERLSILSNRVGKLEERANGMDECEIPHDYSSDW